MTQNEPQGLLKGMCTLNMYRGPLSLILIWHNSHLNLCHSFYGEISQTDNNLFVHTLNIINHNTLKSKPTLFKHIEWQFINAATCCTPLSLGRPILKTFENEELSHINLSKKGLLMVNLFFAEPALSSSSALDMAIDYGGVNEIGTDKQLDMLEIPGKGRCFVFLAR